MPSIPYRFDKGKIQAYFFVVKNFCIDPSFYQAKMYSLLFPLLLNIDPMFCQYALS